MQGKWTTVVGSHLPALITAACSTGEVHKRFDVLEFQFFSQYVLSKIYVSI